MFNTTSTLPKVPSPVIPPVHPVEKAVEDTLKDAPSKRSLEDIATSYFDEMRKNIKEEIKTYVKPLIHSLREAKGEKGDTGPRGMVGEAGRDGKPGKDGALGRDGRDGIDGSHGKDGKNGRDLLMSKELNERLTSIEKLLEKSSHDESTEDINMAGFSKSPYRRFRSRFRVRNKKLTGTIDGVNAVFTFPNIPVLTTEELFVGGQHLFPNSTGQLDFDYTILGQKVTFNNPPQQQPFANYDIP